jgi:hypothetical protein
MEYMYNDPSKLGPHWEQPGRDICCSLLEKLPWPANPEGWAWNSRQRVKWDGDQEGSKFVLKRDVTWEQLEGIYHISMPDLVALKIRTDFNFLQDMGKRSHLSIITSRRILRMHQIQTGMFLNVSSKNSNVLFTVRNQAWKS